MNKILGTLALALAATSAHSFEMYGKVGLPGVIFGVAQSVHPKLTLRADAATLGSHSDNGTKEGIDYQGELRADRVGLFADWFVASGGFRLTGGVTFNDARIELTGRGNGGFIQIGDDIYVVGPGESLDVSVRFPRATPYVGIGYGHQPSGTGWGFVFDLGASIGRATVTASTNIPGVTQADLDRELEELRDSVGKVRAIPQLSVGVNYRF